jgi:hypothetical protein
VSTGAQRKIGDMKIIFILCACALLTTPVLGIGDSAESVPEGRPEDRPEDGPEDRAVAAPTQKASSFAGVVVIFGVSLTMSIFVGIIGALMGRIDFFVVFDWKFLAFVAFLILVGVACYASDSVALKWAIRK